MGKYFVKEYFLEIEITLLPSFHRQSFTHDLFEKTYGVVFYGYSFTYLNGKTLG